MSDKKIKVTAEGTPVKKAEGAITWAPAGATMATPKSMSAWAVAKGFPIKAPITVTADGGITEPKIDEPLPIEDNTPGAVIIWLES